MLFIIMQIAFILSAVPIAIGQTNPPTSDEVVTELNKLLKDMKNNGAGDSEFIEDGESKIPLEREFEINWPGLGLISAMKYIFLGIFLIVIILIFYYIVRSPVIGGYDEQLSTKQSDKPYLQSITDQKRFEKFYGIAREMYQGGNFTETVLNLHKATVEYIHLHKIRHKELSYTNNELSRFITENINLSDAFVKIARESEAILFANIPTSKDKCDILVKSFEQNFVTQ